MHDPNGLPISFYKKYFKFFGSHFVDILNSKDDLPPCFKETIIKMIPKNDNETKGINDLRPISLTNFEYRIYTKILSQRLRKIIGNVISESQTCSMPRRRISDNIIMVNDILNDSQYKSKELFLISVDQSKAFDSISHRYLFKLVKHMKFGDFISDSISVYTIIHLRLSKLMDLNQVK